MNHILCVGESIIDFISLENGKRLEDVSAYTRQPGGSSANVSIGLSRLNTPVSFTGIIGDDYFGRFLEKHLKDNNIDCSLLKKTEKYNTPIVFVSLDECGNNHFFFYRDFKLGNEYKINRKDLKLVNEVKILHFSSVILKQVNFRLQLTKLIDTIKFKNQGLIHFDTNIRFGLWSNQNELRNLVIQFIKLSDVVKFSEKEIYFVTGENDIFEALEHKLLKNKIAIVTGGAAGAYTIFKGQKIHIPAPQVENIVDTTGAGDAFVAAFLSILYKNKIYNIHDFDEIDETQLCYWLKFATAAGTLNCLQRGATAGMTDENNIIKFLNKFS